MLARICGENKMYPSKLTLSNIISLASGVKAFGGDSGGVIPPEPVERWYWDMTRPTYVLLPAPVNINGAFSHKLTGVFNSNSFYLLSNKDSETFRVFLSGTSYNLFAGTTANLVSVVSLGEENRRILESGVHALEYGRDDLGEWYVKIDDVRVGTTLSLYPDFVSYNAFGRELEGSSVPAFDGYHWDHKITGASAVEYPTGELVMPFDEGYNDEHESLEESNGLTILKVGDTPGKYTQTMPS